MISAKRSFIGVWLLVTAIKLLLAARLPLFVDEAFYWQEGRHLAWAYSDLPGLTAWLTVPGATFVPGNVLALRLPFLLMAAALPWLLVQMTARECDARSGWWAGTLCLLLPLVGSLGLMALPDVPLLLASVLCLDAGLRLLRRVDGLALVELALGLAIGGLTHYRFAAVIVVGLIALLAVPQGRRALRQPSVWLVVAVGALAWWPLLLWNWQHGDAGVRFQLLDRNPWSFSWQGLRLGAAQLLPVTPLLLVAMMIAAWRGLRTPAANARYLAVSGTLIVMGFLLLGFFADRQRVSFHWPIPGQVALLPLVAVLLADWKPVWRRLTFAMAGSGLALALAYVALLAIPEQRLPASVRGLASPNFVGWEVLTNTVDTRLARLPAGTQLVAGDFKIGAELGFARNDANLPVLAHPLNDKHGRTPQLRQWGLLRTSRAALGAPPLLLVVSPSHAGFATPEAYLRYLCAQMHALPSPQVVNSAGGRKQFLLVVLGANEAANEREDRCLQDSLQALRAR